MPDDPIVDSHVHLWDPTRFRMPWLDGNERLNRPFSTADYDEHTAGIDVEAYVYLEVDVAPSYRLLEATWAVAQGTTDGRLRGVVACAPLEDGDTVRTFLDALMELGPTIKGVRRLVQGEADLDYCLRPSYVRGVELLGEYGLSCDLGVNWRQLPATVELVRQCPGTRFVLNHLGNPPIRDGIWEPWRDRISEMAALPNVVCKVSGATTAANWESWSVETIRPYVEHVLESFGEDRVLYGGDWPVVLNAAAYRAWVDALDEITAGLSESARRKLWHDNAVRVYRLAGGAEPATP